MKRLHDCWPGEPLVQTERMFERTTRLLARPTRATPYSKAFYPLKSQNGDTGATAYVQQDN
ncbi:Hypothetical protein OINT_2000075 [Brucella intermedia LMG 3301]|uniref:Uncharacterized protein n=1 Tax=Brucella intermedia LMG 3301 TaxID=641118 RepID=C4WLD0_9HYPH|nr:Hypothetical protein OINT_2000075 [Brucella intermedia LMG 3301]